MVSQSINSHKAQPRQFMEVVWYEGTDPVRKGEGVCYNSDYGTATDFDARRTNHVERPKPGNNLMFAGVAARDYSGAHQNAGGQFIEIFNPGSVCEVAIGKDVTINTGLVTAQAGGGQGAGRFSFEGFPGRGSAVPLQTVSSILERVVDGSGSLATDGVTLTVNDSSDMSPGDVVVMLASEDEGSDKKIVPGKYTIDSITDSTTIVLKSSAVGATPSGALNCSYYVYSNNVTALCKLLDGEESGLIEIVSPPNTGSTGVMSWMQGGKTYINGNVTISSANAEGDLADGEFIGERKGFALLAAVSTNNVRADMATNGKQIDNGSGTGLLTLASADFSAAGDLLFLRWVGYWQEQGHDGVTINTS